VAQKNILKAIGDKEMDRKDFLKYSGVVLLSVVGLRGVVSLLSQVDKPVATTTTPEKPRGFGSGRYGA
jgi:hypothetical protein